MFEFISMLLARDEDSTGDENDPSEALAADGGNVESKPSEETPETQRQLKEGFTTTVSGDEVGRQLADVEPGVHDEHAEFLSRVLTDPDAFDTATAGQLGEAYLKQGASAGEFLLTADEALDALVERTFEEVRDGNVEAAEVALKRRLGILLEHMASGVEPFDAADSNGEYADAILTVEEVLEAIPFPVYILDEDTRVIGWNYGHTAFVGMDREEAIGKTSQDSVVKATYSEGARKLTLADKVIDSPRTAHEEYDVEKYETPYCEEVVFYDTSTATNLNDETVHVEFWAVPIFDENDDFVAVFEIIKDRTEEVHAQEGMESLVSEVYETLDALGEGDLTARADFEDEHDAIDDELLTVVEEVNEVGKKLQGLIEEVATQTSELRDHSEDIAESSQTISGKTVAQVEKVEDLSQEVSQLSASVQEIAATAEDIAEGTEQSRQVTEHMREKGKQAREVLSEAADAADDVADDVDALTDRIEQIDEIVDVINDIAEQTNMLALNASIEAARAGEEGEGFAVVADEVKSLAEESQSRAEEIETMVDEIQQDTEQTVSNLRKMNEKVYSGIDQVQTSMEDIHEIVDQIEETADSMEQVSDSTDDQALRTQEVASLADELVNTVEEIADDIEQVADANADQTAQIDEIDDLLQTLASAETVD